MAETKTTKTREEAIEGTLNTIENRYAADIQDINSKIDYAIRDGNFSVFLEYVPEHEVQLYFRDGFNYTIEPQVQKQDDLRKEDIQGVKISWYKQPQNQTVKVEVSER